MVNFTMGQALWSVAALSTNSPFLAVRTRSLRLSFSRISAENGLKPDRGCSRPSNSERGSGQGIDWEK